MSKQNKVNKSNYDQAGRLTPDDMARERERQRAARGGHAEERITGRATIRTARESEASSRRRNEREG